MLPIACLNKHCRSGKHLKARFIWWGIPGDPELITLKALRLMQQADVVIYDRLVSAPILELCRRDATKIYVGKARSNHSVPQEGINALLVDYAKKVNVFVV